MTSPPTLTLMLVRIWTSWRHFFQGKKLSINILALLLHVTPQHNTINSLCKEPRRNANPLLNSLGLIWGLRDLVQSMSRNPLHHVLIRFTTSEPHSSFLVGCLSSSSLKNRLRAQQYNTHLWALLNQMEVLQISKRASFHRKKKKKSPKRIREKSSKPKERENKSDSQVFLLKSS